MKKFKTERLQVQRQILNGIYSISDEGLSVRVYPSLLQKLQNRAARIIMNMSNDTDHSVALQALGWKTLKVERRKAKAKMMYKLLNNIWALNHSLTYSLIKVRWLAIIFETFQVLFVYRNRGLIIWKKVLCTMDHSFGILFLWKLKRANPFLPFGRKSLLTLVIKANICICKYIITSYTISYILILNIFYTMFSIL